MKITKKALYILLSLALVLGAVAVGAMSVSAQTSCDQVYDVPDGELRFGTEKYYKINAASAAGSVKTVYIKAIKDMSNLHIYESSDLQSLINGTVTVVSVNLTGSYTYNSGVETWTISIAGTGNYSSIDSLTPVFDLPDDSYLEIGGVIAISGGEIKHSEGTGWSITVNEDGNSVALSLDNLDLTCDGDCIKAYYLDLTITGSAKLTSTEAASSAINSSWGSLTLNGNYVLRAQNETGSALDCANGNLTVDGGSLDVINTADNEAIFVSGTMTVNGGHIYAESSDKAIFAYEKLTVNGGSVYAKTENYDRAISGEGIILNNNEISALGDKRAKEVLIKKSGELAGKGTADWPYMICDYADLKLFASTVNGTDGQTQNSGACAKLMKDIECKYNPDDEEYATDWTPIGDGSGSGNSKIKYTGTFDGGGHKITGLTFNNTSAYYVGLFGYVGEGGKVQNVGLEGGSITGQYYVGGVAGYNNGGTVTNCYNTGDVSGNDYVGGVAGYNSGTVTNCYKTGNVSGNDFVGGVVGYNNNGGTVTNCYNTGSVTATADYAYAGGVVGYNYGSSSVENCYNTGSVTATGIGSYAGGVVGYIDENSSVKNCYNTGSVKATGADSDVGGVVGYNYRSSTISNCYNTGSVTAQGSNANVGGVVGYNRATVRYCYYDSERCAVSTAIGDGSGTNVKGLTTDQMTGETALANMVFKYNAGETNPWLVKADGASDGKYYWFYPHLMGFEYDSNPTVESWPAKVEVSVTWDGADSYTYNGSEQKPTVTSVTVAGKTLEADSNYTVKYYKNLGEDWSTESVSPVDVGNYKAVLTFTASGYKPIEKEFSIKRKAVTITAGNASKIYDGTPLTQSGFTATELEEGDTHTFTVEMTTDSAITNLGKTENEIAMVDGVSVTAGTAVEVGNYLVTTANGTLTINPVTDEVTVTITGNSDTADYDGSEKSVTGYTATASDALYDVEKDIDFSGTAEAKRTEPGTENMGLDESQFSNNNPNFDNVKFVIAEDGKLTVNPVITFVNEDGTELQSGAVAYGETPEYKGETPVKTENDGYAYEFAAWTPEITEATENATYTATYTQTANINTATFIADGETVDTVHFTVEDSTITEPAVPEKEGNTGEWESYTLGTEDITVNAVYTLNDYNIIYVIDGNETEVTYKYGAAVEKPADPVKDGFNFIGWDEEIPDTMPAENLTITALFEAIPEPEEPTPTEPTPTVPTPTEPTPTEPTPTEPTPTDTEPVHEHDYNGEVTTKPTCTEDGIMTYTCECGESYTQAIAKTGHKPGEWTVVTPATTEAAGKEVRKCTVCGEVIAEREIAKLEPDTADADIVGVNLEKTNAFGIANAFGVDPGKLPAGSTVTWYVNGEKAGEGNGFRVDNPTEDYTIKAVVTNRDGKVIGETEETTVKVNNSFFARLYYWLCRIIQKVIDFFKNLGK